MRNRLLTFAAGGTAAAVVAAGAVFGVVNAQTGGGQPATSPTATPGQQQRQQRQDAIINDFAGHLGISADKVRDALKQTALDQINQAEQNGRLTADQAQQARDQANSGNFAGLGFALGHRGAARGFHRGVGVGIDLQAIADHLKITPQQLRTEMNGHSLADVASNHGSSAADIKQFILSNAQQRLNEAVSSGKMTQQQADKIMADLQSRIDQIVNDVHQPGQPGMGNRPMPGRGRGAQGNSGSTSNMP